MVNTFLLCFNFVLYFLTFIVYQCKKNIFNRKFCSVVLYIPFFISNSAI